MRTVLIGLSALTLAACGQGGGEAEQASAPAAPARPAMSDAERQAVLISLPAPYNEADLENGRRVFARCRSCHTLPEGGTNMTGPNLWGVFGREAGSHPGFRYSEALQAADFRWEAEPLDQWLAAPREFLPGNRMAFAGIPDAADRRDLIAYLKVETGYAPDGEGEPAA